METKHQRIMWQVAVIAVVIAVAYPFGLMLGGVGAVVVWQVVGRSFDNEQARRAASREGLPMPQPVSVVPSWMGRINRFTFWPVIGLLAIGAALEVRDGEWLIAGGSVVLCLFMILAKRKRR